MGLILAVVVTILGCYGVYLLIKLKDSLPYDEIAEERTNSRGGVRE